MIDEVQSSVKQNIFFINEHTLIGATGAGDAALCREMGLVHVREDEVLERNVRRDVSGVSR